MQFVRQRKENGPPNYKAIKLNPEDHFSKSKRKYYLHGQKKQFHWCVRCKHYQCALKFEVKETTSLAFGAALTYTIIRDISI